MLDKYPAGIGVGYVGDNIRVMKTKTNHLIVRGVPTTATTLSASSPTLPGLR